MEKGCGTAILACFLPNTDRTPNALIVVLTEAWEESGISLKAMQEGFFRSLGEAGPAHFRITHSPDRE
jgi:hypothetical protein